MQTNIDSLVDTENTINDVSLENFIMKLAECKNILEAATYTDRVFKRKFGHKLFTLTAILTGNREVQRTYSSGQSDYAIGGRKPVVQNGWSKQVVDQGRPFLGETIDDVIEYFPDHKQISDMGLGAVLNLPVIFCGETIGTLNILDRDYAYDQNQAEEALIYTQILAPFFVSFRTSGDRNKG